MNWPFAANGGRVPAYLFHYPYSPLVVGKIYFIINTAINLVLWNELKPWLRKHHLYAGMAVADLISLLFVLISLWFALQKFFWVKVECTLVATSIIFTCLAIACIWGLEESYHIGIERQLHYLVICHCYLLLAQIFSLSWTVRFTRNNVSNLFISNWGAEVNYNELQQLDRDF